MSPCTCSGDLSGALVCFGVSSSGRVGDLVFGNRELRGVSEGLQHQCHVKVKFGGH
jgi:hypothetical protein